MEAYRNLKSQGNSKKYRTGKPCIEGCGREAGTLWSPLWCPECNIKRMDHISKTLEKLHQACYKKSENND